MECSLKHVDLANMKHYHGTIQVFEANDYMTKYIQDLKTLFITMPKEVLEPGGWPSVSKMQTTKFKVQSCFH